MNVKELLIVVLLALVTTWGIEYLFFGKKEGEATTVASGQSFVAPKTAQEMKPLDLEVDFVDAKRSAPVTSTEIDTEHANLVFTTDGASLERLEFKRRIDGWPQELTTIFPVASTDKEQRCFLIGLTDETPFYYKLIEQKNREGQTTELTYEAQTSAGAIRKKFIIYKDSPKIDLILTLKPADAVQGMQARIFYPAPVMPDIAAEDITCALMYEQRGAITMIPRRCLYTDIHWATSTFFGVDDRYFVHAMISDADHFSQRGYYKLTGQNDIYAILEGPVVTQETSWKLSYYCGPKESKAMNAVDPRLEQTLGYAGWFAPIARFLLMVLVFLYGYLHNYGLAIIALTIITKILLLPFSLKGAQSMKRHAEVQKKLKYLQQKYKDDAETLARERADLMRKEGLGSLSGCLPLLLQLPIFFALSRVLSTSIELYQAPFGFWITDLSAKDPYYILPLLIVASMLLQATTVDAAQRVQLIVMAVVFGAITASLSAGLCLYIFMSTILGVAQTMLQKRYNLA